VKGRYLDIHDHHHTIGTRLGLVVIACSILTYRYYRL